MKRDVVVIIGAGGIGTAIARRQGFGKPYCSPTSTRRPCSLQRTICAVLATPSKLVS
jgi:lactate dehydrogenase-like 2-hydroxyacid dehydrogenase